MENYLFRFVFLFHCKMFQNVHNLQMHKKRTISREYSAPKEKKNTVAARKRKTKSCCIGNCCFSVYKESS